MKARWLTLAVLALASASCSDPLLDGSNHAQGNETSGVDQGEFHRPGSACTSCHREGGEASDSPFTIAGTIFAQPLRQVGVDSAEIRLTDSDSTKFLTKTNCVGNFFVKPSDWQPKFPVLVDVAKGAIRRQMRSPIGRETSCSVCHTPEFPVLEPLSQLGHIYLYGGDEPGAKDGLADCPVDPVRPGSADGTTAPPGMTMP